MKDFQQDEDFKLLIKGTDLPEIDVKDSVMERIYESREKVSKGRRKKLITIVLVASILILTAGFAVMKVWNLQGPGGDSYSLELLDRYDERPPQSVYLQEYENLKPGEAISVMKTRDNPKDTIFTYSKPIIVKSLTEMAGIVGDRFKVISGLPTEFEFVNGSVNYQYDDYDREEMIKASKNTSQEYITRVLKPKDEIWYYGLNFMKNNHNIILTVYFDYPDDKIQMINDGQRVTKVTFNGFEAIYMERDSIANLTWLDERNGEKIWISIHTQSYGADTINDLVILGESMY